MDLLIEYILLSGIIISGFLSLLLVQKKNKSVAEIILLLWVCSSGYVTFSYLLVFNGNYLQYPTLTAIGSCIPLLSGPFMYLYIKYQTKPLFFQKVDLLHFVPFVLSNLLFISFYFLPFEARVEELRNKAANYASQGFIKLIATYLSGIIYITWSFVLLYSYKKRLKKEFSNPENISFNWLLMLNIGLSIIWIIVMFIQDDRIIFSSGAIYIICIGFFGISQVKVFTERDLLYVQNREQQNEQTTEDTIKKDIETKQVKLIDGNVEDIYFKTIDLVKRDKLYLNPELKVLDLAILMDIHPNLMSKAINQVSDANFYDLVNKMRVEEFINRAKMEDAGKYTIIALAYDSGFNSKASFYRNFKTITGLSPSEFLKSEQHRGLDANN